MVSLDQLKKKKEMLLKKAGMKRANLETIKQREAEKRKLKAEIYALEHPGSSRARSALKSAVRGFGRSVANRANIVAENAVRIQNQKKAEARRERELEILKLRAAAKRKRSKKKK